MDVLANFLFFTVKFYHSLPKRKNAEVDLAASRGTDQCQQLAVGHNEEPKWSLHSSENNLHIFRRCTDSDGNPPPLEKKIRLQDQDADDIVADWSQLPSEIWLKCW